MEITYLGKTDFKIKGKNASLSVGDNKVTILRDDPFEIKGPGEYEVSEVLVLGVANGQNVIYRMTVDGVTICHLDLLAEKLTQEKLEKIGPVDILMIPVVDDVSKIAVQFDPKIVIPMNFSDITKFLESMGKKDVLPMDKLVTNVDKLPTELQVVWLK